MRNILLTISLASIVACGGHVGGHHHEEEEHHGSSDEIVIEPEKAQKIGISVITAQKTPFCGIIKACGKIENDLSHSWNIVADCSGQVTYIKSDIMTGVQVSRSEKLFRIKSGALNNQNSVSELDNSRAVLEHAKAEYQRAEKLRKDQLVTESELLQAKMEYNTAQTRYDRLNKVVNSDLSSPANGFITSILVDNGQYVEEGGTIATVSTGKDLIIEAYLPGRYSSCINDITGANFTIGADEEVYTAEKRLTSSDIVNDGGTYIPIHFKTAKLAGLIAGMPIDVYIKTGSNRTAISIPKSAITEKFGKYCVYVRLDEDCYASREVTLGETDGASVEILSGISEGEDIVVHGVYYVKMAGNSTAIPHGHSH